MLPIRKTVLPKNNRQYSISFYLNKAPVFSPSVWFPGFIDYIREHEIKSKTVYLSLGDREEKTRNPVMAQVGNCIRSGYDRLKKCGVDCTLEWNSGNHYREPDMRTAKAFAWILNQKKN